MLNECKRMNRFFGVLVSFSIQRPALQCCSVQLQPSLLTHVLVADAGASMCVCMCVWLPSAWLCRDSARALILHVSPLSCMHCFAEFESIVNCLVSRVFVCFVSCVCTACAPMFAIQFRCCDPWLSRGRGAVILHAGVVLSQGCLLVCISVRRPLRL